MTAPEITYVVSTARVRGFDQGDHVTAADFGDGVNIVALVSAGHLIEHTQNTSTDPDEPKE